jgi:tetratricopeptide (TPR) repeat protein
VNIARRFFWIFSCTLATISLNAHPLFDSVAKYQFTDASRSLIYLQRIEKIRATLPDSLKGKYNNELGIYYAIQGENKKALQQFRASLQYADVLSVRRAGAYANIANVYKALGNYSYANKVLLKAWYIYKELGEEELQYSILGEMAANDYYALNWSRSMRRTLAVVHKMEDSENQKFLHVQKQRLANLYFSLGWQKKAIPMYLTCENYYKKEPKEQMNLAYVCINLGDAYIEINKPLLAIPRYQKAISLLENTDRYNYLLAMQN